MEEIKTYLEEILSSNQKFVAGYVPDHNSELVEMLKKEGSFDMFDDGRIIIGTTTKYMRYCDVAPWIIEQSEHRGVVKALELLQEYIDMEEIEAYLIMPMQNPLEQDYTLSNGATFLRTDSGEVPQEFLKEIEKFHRRNYMSVLLVPLKLPMKVVKESEYRQHINTDSPETDMAHSQAGDLINAINLDVTIGDTISKGDITLLWSDIRFPHSYSLKPTYESESFSIPRITKGALEKADLLLEQLSTVQNKPRLDVIMKNLSGYASDKGKVERLRDLRTAMENLFGDKGEPANDYKIRTRMARYVGKDINERAEIRDLAKNVYDLASKAVHGSEIGEKDLSEADDVYQLLTEMVKGILNEGEFTNWRDFDIS